MIVISVSLVTTLSGDDSLVNGLFAFRIDGDAVPAPLGGLVGDPEQGRQIVMDRQMGNCLICHSINAINEPFQGVLGPALDDVGRRLSPGQLRLRVINQRRINPAAIMPPYYHVEGLLDVDPIYRGRPILDAQQVEDVVAFLATLKE
ncbi:MAG: sulfur oxidation c-type cytochrome SoxX [Hyphomicrobiaceae bacterium]